MKSRLVFIALVLILAVAAPFGIYPVFLMKALCFALFAVAFNLLLGYAGLLSFGHAAFFGMASYVCGHAMTRWGVTPEIAILAGTAAAGLMGLVFGYIAIRRQGIYFAMVTLALAQMVYFFCLQAPFTHGEDGIQAIPRGKLFGLLPLDEPHTLYYFVLVVFIAGTALVWRTVHSPFGQVLRAIRENEPRAISLGYRTTHYKLLAFVLSASSRRSGRRHQGAGVPAGFADRRPLAHLGRGGADDLAGRHGHRAGPDRRRLHRGDDRE